MANPQRRCCFLDDFSDTEIIQYAVEARKKAFAIITGTRVGAAVRTKKGNIYPGCNIESIISGLGVCAERCAVDNAVANGEYVFTAIAIATEKRTKPIPVCGACLQYLYQFQQIENRDIIIIMVDERGRMRNKPRKLTDMLPYRFGPRDMGIPLEKYRNCEDLPLQRSTKSF